MFARAACPCDYPTGRLQWPRSPSSSSRDSADVLRVPLLPSCTKLRAPPQLPERCAPPSPHLGSLSCHSVTPFASHCPASAVVSALPSPRRSRAEASSSFWPLTPLTPLDQGLVGRWNPVCCTLPLLRSPLSTHAAAVMRSPLTSVRLIWLRGRERWQPCLLAVRGCAHGPAVKRRPRSGEEAQGARCSASQWLWSLSLPAIVCDGIGTVCAIQQAHHTWSHGMIGLRTN